MRRDLLDFRFKLFKNCFIGGNTVHHLFHYPYLILDAIKSLCNCLLCLQCCCWSEALSLSFSFFKHATSSSKYLTLITLVTWENWVASRPSVLSKRETWLPLCKTLSRNAQTSPHTAAKAWDFDSKQARPWHRLSSYWKANVQYYAVSQYSTN